MIQLIKSNQYFTLTEWRTKPLIIFTDTEKALEYSIPLHDKSTQQMRNRRKLINIMGLPKGGFSSVQSLSRVRLFATPWIAAPGLPVHHQLPEFTETHIHRVTDAIQPFHPLSSPSPPAPNPSQHQSLFQWVNSSHEMAKVLEFQLQHHSFQRNLRADLLQNGLA